jgi:hypothetical protein
MMFHGAYSSRAEAEREKKRKRIQGFIRPADYPSGRRWMILSPRKNPIRRKKRNLFAELKGSMFDPGTGKWAAWERSKRLGSVRGEGETRREAERDLKEQMRERKRAARSGNPLDLVVMGANPHRAKEARIEALETEIGRILKSFSPEKRRELGLDLKLERFTEELNRLLQENPQGREITVQPGQTITFKFNPDAETIREEFTGRPADRLVIYREPHMPKGEYAKLGDVMGLTYKPIGGGQVEGFQWYEGNQPLHEAAKKLLKLVDAPIAVADETRRQIYFVGGDQKCDLEYQARHNNREDVLWELGEMRTIVYRERKRFDDFALVNYEHRFGEETGNAPKLLYDPKKKRLLLQGGDYQVRPEGIVN